MMSDVIDIEKVYNCPEILEICKSGRLPSFGEMKEFMPEELSRVYLDLESDYEDTESDYEDTESETDSGYDDTLY